jgi:L,D-transpeptidase YnhG
LALAAPARCDAAAFFLICWLSVRIPFGRPWREILLLVAALAAQGILAPSALAQNNRPNPNPKASPKPANAPVPRRGFDAEARLIQIYQAIGLGQSRSALKLAEQLVRDHPNFALAQLVYGDLLAAQARPLQAFGAVPEAAARAAPGVLTELREESLLRIRAIREKPPAGMVPAQFLRLSARNKHAIAVDASRARLYVFENSPQGIKLIADYYMSVGKLGIDKNVEGDQRTPLGIYYITNTLSNKVLDDFYGAGALPINYPNPFDLRRGKTGSGIWLHGTPSNQYARAPKASDGCIVLSNPDLERILRTVETRTTPVVIAPRLEWVNPQQSRTELTAFDEVWQQWRASKSSGDLTRTLAFYTSDFDNYGKKLADWSQVLQTEMNQMRGRTSEIKDMSVLHWTDPHNGGQSATMVVTFSEVPAGRVAGPTKRQYWLRSKAATNNQWKMFFEGVIG